MELVVFFCEQTNIEKKLIAFFVALFELKLNRHKN